MHKDRIKTARARRNAKGSACRPPIRERELRLPALRSRTDFKAEPRVAGERIKKKIPAMKGFARKIR